VKAGTKGQMKCCMQVSLWSVFKTTKLTKVFYLSKQKLENPLMWPCGCFAWVSLFDGCQFPVFFSAYLGNLLALSVMKLGLLFLKYC
jgi:hypothetical protein